ncbi:hypothetical protein PUN32_00505 [Vibrio sp. dsl-7]|uniref:ExoP galactose-binding-like domain-containing protein n=1 Tax=Vibrio chanodichtyis TaxID=3027932 RepID=A0ABT5UVQ2_9VIBR|nr:hypothetical protein [Vibrio chanodichtyis]MDE1513492.1 hypothetical protein [Vibrio chanodichtyis]
MKANNVNCLVTLIFIGLISGCNLKDRDINVDFNPGSPDSPAFNSAPALSNGDFAVFYSGDFSLATDLSDKHKFDSFGAERELTEDVIDVLFPGNGGIFFEPAVGQVTDLSELYAAGVMTIDLKVKNYGESNEIQVRLESATPQYDNYYQIGVGQVPAGGDWYRCQLLVSDLAPSADYLNAAFRTPYISGVWDSMADLQFTLANVAFLVSSSAPNGNTGCRPL